jgi:hypothetical protein
MLSAQAGARLDAASTVFVQARESGQGVLRGRGNECFVVTPAHVVQGATGSVRVTGERSVQASAVLQRAFAGDIAALRVETPGTLSCPDWTPVTGLDALLGGRDAGTLSVREADGSRTLMSVGFTAIDDELIFVRPVRANDQISRSMSGSALLVDGRIVGILLSVEDGAGQVYQIDDIMRVSAEFFAPAAKVPAAAASLAGQYNFGGMIVTIQATPAGLQYIQPGAPVHLLVAGAEGQFTSPTIPGGTLEFRRDANGALDALYLKLQQGVAHGPRVEGAPPDAATLRSLVGTYYINDAVSVTVALRGDGVLTYRATPDPVDWVLIPARGLHFAFQGNAVVSTVFHRDASGRITHMVVSAADTTVVATRR